MKHAVCLSAALVIAGVCVAPASADVMVELFTSQGCSSCPPADSLLGEMAERDGVVALSFHVDYWDYLGWKDTFADPAYTARQVDYRTAWSEAVVYTPQAVVQGRETVRAYSASALDKAITAADSIEAIRIEAEDGAVHATLLPQGNPQPCVVWVAQFLRHATVPVERGENAGKSLDYHNVVTGLQKLGSWSGSSEETLMLPVPGEGEGVAVWLQDGEGGPILAAAQYKK